MNPSQRQTYTQAVHDLATLIEFQPPPEPSFLVRFFDLPHKPPSPFPPGSGTHVRAILARASRSILPNGPKPAIFALYDQMLLDAQRHKLNLPPHTAK